MIPAPQVGRKRKYDFSQLEIGERMEIAAKDKLSATQSAYAYGTQTGKKFAVRALPEGIFIYRTEPATN